MPGKLYSKIASGEQAISNRSEKRLEQSISKNDMSIDISVGDLAALINNDSRSESLMQLRKEIRRINRLLRKYNLPEHREPEHLPEIPLVDRIGNLGITRPSELRRFAAYIHQGVNPVALPGGTTPWEDPVLKAAYKNKSCTSHLVLHSEFNGYFVPIDFPAPLASKLLTRVPGYYLGSSIRLMQELRALAPHLNLQDLASSMEIALDQNKLSEDEIYSLADEVWLYNHTFARERMVWLKYFVFAHASVRYKTMIKIQ